MILAMALQASSSTAAVQPEAAGERLNQVIHRAIHADGPFLVAEERALVERKCGYTAGSWDGNDFSMNNGVLTCTNGRRVDDPEVRAMMARAAPRISRRVEAAMARPDVRAAIEAVAREASEEALSRLGERSRRRR
jgi:hypothetical protein